MYAELTEWYRSHVRASRSKQQHGKPEIVVHDGIGIIDSVLRSGEDARKLSR